MKDILKNNKLESPFLGVSTGSESWKGNGLLFKIKSPVDGCKIGEVQGGDNSDFERIIENSEKAFKTWRKLPAPQRGELVRQFGEEL